MTASIKEDPTTAIINAIEENLFQYIRLFATHPGNRYHEDKQVLQFISDIDIPSMQSNSVYKLTCQNISRRLAGILQPFKDSKKPLFLTAGPSADQSAIKDIFKKNGIMHVQSQKGMAISLETIHNGATLPPNVTVKQVRTHLQLQQFLRIYTAGFDYSQKLADFIFRQYRELFFDSTINWYHYIAYYNEKPVATSSLFVSGNIAGLYNIVTLPEARRKGIASTMTLFPMLKAMELECHMAILHATELGAYVYTNLGFREYCTFDLYMKLYGKSRITFPAVYVGKQVSNRLRKLFMRL